MRLRDGEKVRELHNSFHGAASKLVMEETGSNLDRGMKRERQKQKDDQKDYVYFGQ